MQNNDISYQPDSLLSRKEVAALLGVTTRTLTNYATNGDGPKYFKLNRRVLYKYSDFLEWLEQRQHQSTCEYMLN